MKKVLLLLLLSSVTCLLKAQQLIPVKPADSLSNKITDHLFKKLPDNKLNLFQPQLNLNQPLAALTANTVTNNNNYKMPVVVFTGNDRMPVAKLNGYDKILIRHIDIVDPNSMVQQATPGKMPR